MKSEHEPQADGHVRVAREVKIDLDGKGHDSQNSSRGTDLGEVPGLQAEFDDLTGVVGDQDLLGQTPEKAQDPCSHPIQSDFPAVEFPLNVGIADDGARDQLGKEGDIEQKTGVGTLDPDFTPVKINDVGQGLEGIEGDADRQCYLRYLKIEKGQRVQNLHHKARVFEIDKACQGKNNGCHKPAPARTARTRPSQENPAQPDHKAGKEKQDHINWFAPGVEKERSQEEENVLRARTACQPGSDQTGGQEDI